MKTVPQVLAVVAVAAASLTGCGSQEDAEAKAPVAATAEQCVDANTKTYADDRPSDVDSVHGNAGLLELKKLSALTVAGTVTAVEDGVEYGQEKKLAYAVVTIRPSETLKGTAQGQVRLAVSSTQLDGHHFSDAAYPVPAVGACGIWFLVPWGKEYGFDGYGSVSNSSELLFDSHGKFTNHADLPALEEAEKLGTRDAVLTLLRSAP